MIYTNALVKLGKVRGNKMVDRRAKMIMQELGIEYDEAQ